MCLKEVSSSVSKTSDGVRLARIDRYASLSIETNQIVMYIHIPVPLADGTVNPNRLQRKSREQ